MTDFLHDPLILLALQAAVTWGVIRTEARYWRAAINAAHRRLDKIGAPPAGGDVLS